MDGEVGAGAEVAVGVGIGVVFVVDDLVVSVVAGAVTTAKIKNKTIAEPKTNPIILRLALALKSLENTLGWISPTIKAMIEISTNNKNK